MDAGAMSAMEATLQVKPWSGLDFLLMFLMWAVMMVAMMVPSAAPMILLFAAIHRKQRERRVAVLRSVECLRGRLYVAIWSAFSLAATLLQWGLEQAALLSPMMVGTSPMLGGGLLVVAGLYQWSSAQAGLPAVLPLADPILESTACARAAGGAFVMGLEHGAFCVGCCWIADGIVVRGRRDESALGRRHRRLRPAREGAALRRARRTCHRRLAGARRARSSCSWL